MRTPVEIIKTEIERLEFSNEVHAKELLESRTKEDRARALFDGIQKNKYAIYILNEVRIDVEKEIK